MKRFSLALAVLCTVLLLSQVAFGQKKDNEKKEREVHVKVKLIEDGKEKVIDTVFRDLKNHGNVIKMMKLEGVADSLIKERIIWLSDNKHTHKGKHKMIQTLCLARDSTISIDLDCDAKVIKKLKLTDCDSAKHENIMIELLHAGDHKIHKIPRAHRKEQIIIINDSEDVELTEKDGYKIIKIKTSVDDDVWIEEEADTDVDVGVKIDEKDVKTTRKIKRKKKKENK